MRFLPDPLTLQARLRDPLSWAGLAIDLLPVWAVFALGWKAGPLVTLYWLENGIVGFWALARMLTFGLLKGPGALIGAVFMGVFFTFHYGMFWFVHGVFVQALTGSGVQPGDGPVGIDDGPVALAQFMLGTWPGMPFFALMAFCWGGVVFLADYIIRGGVHSTDLGREMAAPYGRVVVLHIGIFAGFFALQAIGEPAVGILALILLHAVWNVFTRLRPRETTPPASAPGEAR